MHSTAMRERLARSINRNFRHQSMVLKHTLVTCAISCCPWASIRLAGAKKSRAGVAVLEPSFGTGSEVSLKRHFGVRMGSGSAWSMSISRSMVSIRTFAQIRYTFGHGFKQAGASLRALKVFKVYTWWNLVAISRQDNFRICRCPCCKLVSSCYWALRCCEKAQ